jgi:uncharacterized Zn finger protein
MSIECPKCGLEIDIISEAENDGKNSCEGCGYHNNDSGEILEY